MCMFVELLSFMLLFAVSYTMESCLPKSEHKTYTLLYVFTLTVDFDHYCILLNLT